MPELSGASRPAARGRAGRASALLRGTRAGARRVVRRPRAAGRPVPGRPPVGRPRVARCPRVRRPAARVAPAPDHRRVASGRARDGGQGDGRPLVQRRSGIQLARLSRATSASSPTRPAPTPVSPSCSTARARACRCSSSSTSRRWVADRRTTAMPGGVRELLQARVGSVGDAGRAQLLAAAAVIGRSFDVETLRDTSGRSDEEMVTGLEELNARAADHRAADGYDFTHEKLRELVREQASLARSRLLHRRVAEALVGRRADPAVVAHHLPRGGPRRRGRARLPGGRRAGAGAARVRRGARALPRRRSPSAAPSRRRLHEAIGDVHTMRGEYGSARVGVRDGGVRSAAAGRLAGIEHKLGRVHDRRGEPELAERHLPRRCAWAASRRASTPTAASSRIAAGGDAEAHALARRALRAGRGEAVTPRPSPRPTTSSGC